MAAAIIPQPTLDYSSKDFDSLLARVNNLVDSVFPDWSSKNRADFGNILVRLFCFIGDVLGFYLDNHALESRIATATQRRSLIALAKLLNYIPSGASAATVDCTITLAAIPTNDVVFPAGTIARTLAVTDPVEFQLLAAATILALADPPTVTATFEHSKTFPISAPATGLPAQEVILGETPFIDDSEDVSAGNGAYTKVANFLESTTTDRHYMVIVDQNDQARLRFGNGVNGELPTGTITGTYRTGGGDAGNVEKETIQKLVGNFTDTMGNPVVPSIINPAEASGGADRDSLEQIRQDTPASTRVLNRTVAREDYEINALRVSGVARALMLTSNEDVRVAENAGNLYIIPSGGGTPSQALLDDVETMVMVTYPNTLTFDLAVMAASYLTVNIETRVYISVGQTPSTVKTRIVSSLTEYFALTNIDGSQNLNVAFGYEYQARGQGALAEIPFSDIYNAIRDTVGVYKIKDTLDGVLLNGAFADLSIDVNKFPVLGTVTVINAETGAEIT